mmetsp:Transcript_18719/g.20175  ORF Transcript_18719/g.20175 Transcript_18719/m.20175 type:complete len:103 (+) Transcript_18719:7-315(+)
MTESGMSQGLSQGPSIRFVSNCRFRVDRTGEAPVPGPATRSSTWQATTEQHEPPVRDTGAVKAVTTTGVAPAPRPATRESQYGRQRPNGVSHWCVIQEPSKP